jgi:Fur family transcriptional regulator, ferric uptake regulator
MNLQVSTTDPVGLANEILAKLPGRRTRGRTSVLSSLIESRGALTHTEIESALPPDVSLDRVTLYRILDWLCEHGVAHRVSASDRAIRYAFTQSWGAGGQAAATTHAHYQCDKCARVGCLDNVDTQNMQVPDGLVKRHVDILVHVTCTKPDCEFAKPRAAR